MNWQMATTNADTTDELRIEPEPWKEAMEEDHLI
jgi:hypothetical protein